MKRELIEVLKELNKIFYSVDEEFWNNKVKLKITEIENGQILEDYLCASINEWFGGMGSLNDLYICMENGHNIDKISEEEINKRIADLTNSLYEICSK